MLHDVAVNFGVIGILIALTGVTARTKRLPVVIRFLSSVILIIALMIYGYFVQPDLMLSEKKWYDHSPALEVLLFALMVLGMGASYFAKQIENRRGLIAKLRATGDNTKPPLEFDPWEFSYPLLISVIMFGVVLERIQESSLTFSSRLISFETGFFWQTILASKNR
jgi:hypothetical protein